MGFSINVQKVQEILLADQQWHPAMPGSFEIVNYEFEVGNRRVLGGGGATGISEIGVTWRDPVSGDHYACPLSSVLAVKFSP
ncbi:MAG TPA: hypothetical protein VNK46_07720 [Nitrospiraceae bacterium]|jgi:hypothetical protein|nr:hypothetical protein [Nitrospiraceae bacterium]